MFIVEGVKTSLPLHQNIVSEPDFVEGNYHVGFLERYLPHASRKPHEPAETPATASADPPPSAVETPTSQ
jgi:hypothetical protein